VVGQILGGALVSSASIVERYSSRYAEAGVRPSEGAVKEGAMQCDGGVEVKNEQ
jgi:hypothetical protein